MQVNIIKQIVQHRKGVEGVIPPSDVVVSMFTVDGKSEFFIGFVHDDGRWSPYHSGQRQYINKVWKTKFEIEVKAEGEQWVSH